MAPGNLKILFVSAECAPFAKTGGLADVAGSLPKALKDLGHEVRLVLPYYQAVRNAGYGKELVKSGLTLRPFVPETGLKPGFDLRKDTLPGADIPVYLIDHPDYFDREGLYGLVKGEQRGDYDDNLDRFAFFAHAALTTALEEGFVPDLIHCHDWHTGLIPAFLRTFYGEEKGLKNAGTLFTIHNLAYQGIFPDHQFKRLGLPGEMFQAEGIEFYGQVNFMKAGLRYCDRINTVSPRYAEEIQGQEFGSGLDGVLRARKDRLSGIINGLDYSQWSPEADTFISHKYGKESLDLKEQLKADFIKKMKLDWDGKGPLLAIVSRLDEMKGLTLLEEIMDYLMHMDLCFVLLGTGEERFERRFGHFRDMYPEKASIHLTFDNALAHEIEAAADFFLMPSRFEPCGLNQLISLRYGTIPVVRATGGLFDTVKEFDPKTGQGNGFVFHEFSSMGLFNAIKRAMEIYRNKELLRKVQVNGMGQDFSWGASARQYVELYKTVIEERKAG